VFIAGWWKGMLLKQNIIDRAKGHVVKVTNFLFIFIVHVTMIVLLSRKQELTNEFWNYFRILRPQNIKIVYSLNHNIQSSKICWTVLLASSCLFFCLPVRIEQVVSHWRILMKFDIWGFFENLSRRFKFH